MVVKLCGRQIAGLSNCKVIEYDELHLIRKQKRGTKDLDVKEAFKQCIRSHYYDDANNYDEALASLMDLRQAMRTPSRNNQGVALLLQYYNQLHFVERRFFTPDKTCGRLHFHW